MLVNLVWYLIILLLIFPYGSVILILTGRNDSYNPILPLLTGLAVTGLLSQFFLLGGSPDTFSFIVLSLGAITIAWRYKPIHRIYRNNLISWIKSLSPLEIACGILLIFLIAYQSAIPTKMNDMGMYYLQTFQWMKHAGLVKGLANIHPAYSLYSSWHSELLLLGGGSEWILNPVIPAGTWGLNGVLIYLFIVYAYAEIRIRKTTYFLLILPLIGLLGWFFLTAPAPDLPVIVFTVLIIYWSISRTLSPAALLILCIFIFSVKPPALVAVAIGIYSFIKLVKETLASLDFRSAYRKLPLLLLPFILSAPTLYKNYIQSGYLLYPSGFPDVFNVEWKVPTEVNKAYLNGLPNWGTRDEINDQKFLQKSPSNLSEFRTWLFRSGYKGWMNRFIFLTFLLGLGTFMFSLIRQRKVNPELITLILLLVVDVAEWFLLRQYRLMLPTSLTLAGLISFITLTKVPSTGYAYSLIALGSIYLIFTFLPLNLFTRSSRNKQITTTGNFSTEFVVKPFSTYKSDSIYRYSNPPGFYYPGNTSYCWDCPIPCQSMSHKLFISKLFLYKIQPLGPEIKDGFKLIKETDSILFQSNTQKTN